MRGSSIVESRDPSASSQWLCAPKGTAFLWARRDAHAGLHPACISHGFRAGLRAEFSWEGTRDLTCFLALPAATAALRHWGPSRVREHNNSLASRAAAHCAKAWGTAGVLPQAGAALAGMVAVQLPGGLRGCDSTAAAPNCCGAAGCPGSAAQPCRGVCAAAARWVHEQLRDRHAIEVPVVAWEGRLWARLSAQLVRANVALPFHAPLREAFRYGEPRSRTQLQCSTHGTVGLSRGQTPRGGSVVWLRNSLPPCFTSQYNQLSEYESLADAVLAIWASND